MMGKHNLLEDFVLDVCLLKLLFEDHLIADLEELNLERLDVVFLPLPMIPKSGQISPRVLATANRKHFKMRKRL